MTNYTLTPALREAVLDLYDERCSFENGHGYGGYELVASAWAHCADGFSGSLDDLVAAVADFLVCNDCND